MSKFELTEKDFGEMILWRIEGIMERKIEYPEYGIGHYNEMIKKIIKILKERLDENE